MKNKDWFTIKQIKQNIWAICEFKHPEKVISYLIVGKDRALLFDTGLGIGDIKQEIIKITNKPIIVLNSHFHYDHIGGNNKFKDKPNKITSRKEIKNEFHLNPFKFSLLKTPGHTRDSIVLYEKNLKYLFSGDTFYPGAIYLFLPDSSFKDYKKTISKLCKLDKKTTIFPAHNGFKCSIKDVQATWNQIKLLKDEKSIKKIKINSKISLLLDNVVM